MAKAAAKVVSKGNGAAEAASMPSDFRLRSVVSDASWFSQEENNVCFGKLLGRHKMMQEPVRFYYQVELKAVCNVRVGRGEDAEVQQADVGDVVNVNEMHNIKCLAEIEIPEILAGAEYDVHIACGEKVKIGGGKTLWNVKVGSKQRKPPTRAVQALPADDAEDAAAGSPF